MRGNEHLSCGQKLSREEAVTRINGEDWSGRRAGQLVITSGVCSLPGYGSYELLRELAEHVSFEAASDPDGERDFGNVQIFGATLMWKIDYYDLKLESSSYHAPEADIITRVLTIMLESEN